MLTKVFLGSACKSLEPAFVSVDSTYLDNQLVVSITVQAKMSNICWVHPLKRKDLLLFFDIYDVLGFWLDEGPLKMSL